MTNLPLIMAPAGPIPTPPLTLLQALISGVSSTNPGYTANLPGSLIEDISSTDVGAMSVMDQARVDAINGVSPLTANAYTLYLLGQQLGIPRGLENNASVYVVISGTPGYLVIRGFTVSDGINQYIILTGGAVSTSGSTAPLYAVALNPGQFAIPANTVNTVITSVPSEYGITVTNPTAGTPSTSEETVPEYRGRVFQGTIVTTQGSPSYIKTLVSKVPGVIPRLVAVAIAGGLKVIVGGGDPFQVAGAIYSAILDPSMLVGSLQPLRNISASIIDVPDTYNIKWVNPPQQVVTADIIWNTTLPNFGSSPQVNTLGAQAAYAYFNSISVGNPINILDLQDAFKSAVQNVLPKPYLTTLEIEIKIDGIVRSPSAGTSIIPGDTEGYFFANLAGVVVTQGGG